MAEYKSRYTGQEIDAGIAKANTALQEHQNISGKQDKLTSKNAGSNVTITEVDGIVKINSVGGGTGTSDFNALENRPKYNGQEMSGNTEIPEVKTNEWDSKQDQLVSGTNIKTINNQSLLGTGNIKIESGGISKKEISIDINKNNYIYEIHDENTVFNNININIENDNNNIKEQNILKLDENHVSLLKVEDEKENQAIMLGDISKEVTFNKNGNYSQDNGFDSVKANVNENDYDVNEINKKTNLIIKYLDDTEELLEISSGTIEKNLFDKDNNEFWRTKTDKAYYLSGTRVAIGNNINAGRVYRIDCEPNTTYTLSAICTKIMRLGCYHENDGEDSFEDIRSSGTSSFTINKVVENPDSSTALKYRTLSITTGEDDNRLVFQFGANDIEAILPTIQIEEGNIATEYKPFYNNTSEKYVYFKTGEKEEDSVIINISAKKEVN